RFATIMSAFGRRNGMGNGSGSRPSFGTAKPMKGPVLNGPKDGDQFPPIDQNSLGLDEEVPPSVDRSDAMARLTDRQALSGEQTASRSEGFEAAIHRIKEQVLPRLLERVDPEAA